MLLIYAHNTRKKTGWIVTEDIIPPRGGPYRPISYSHPDTAKAELLMLALSRFFVHDTNRCSRPTLKQAYEGAQQYLANPQDYKYLSATSTAAERILVK